MEVENSYKANLFVFLFCFPFWWYWEELLHPDIFLMNFCGFTFRMGREEPVAGGHGGECLPGSGGVRDWMNWKERRGRVWGIGSARERVCVTPEPSRGKPREESCRGKAAHGWRKVGYVPLEIPVSRKYECWWLPAELLCTSQESIFPKVVLLGVLICAEKEGRGCDQNSLSAGGPHTPGRSVHGSAGAS